MVEGRVPTNVLSKMTVADELGCPLLFQLLLVLQRLLPPPPSHRFCACKEVKNNSDRPKSKVALRQRPARWIANNCRLSFTGFKWN